MWSKSVVLLWRYCNFSSFSKWPPPPSSIFGNSEILLAIGAERVEGRQRAKLRQNRSIGGEDIKIFRFFNMAATATLDCRIHKILLVDSGRRAQMYHFTKFRQNRSFHCGDVAIFRIFKMAAAAILDFWNREILLAFGVEKVVCISMPNFVKIGQLVAKILRFFTFSRCRPPPSWIVEFIKFYWMTVSEGLICITVPNFIKSVVLL